MLSFLQQELAWPALNPEGCSTIYAAPILLSEPNG
jgi:hypothetical protein